MRGGKGIIDWQENNKIFWAHNDSDMDAIRMNIEPERTYLVKKPFTEIELKSSEPAGETFDRLIKEIKVIEEAELK